LVDIVSPEGAISWASDACGVQLLVA